MAERENGPSRGGNSELPQPGELELTRRAGAGARIDALFGIGAPVERLAFSIDEVAQITGLSRDLLYDQMRRGHLAYIKVGRRRIISRQHLEVFLSQGAA
ncbi:MAG: helix-turn-helix domain-containing protein [Streptosporangiaceae bacterium]